ncbi:MAG: thiamine phosphate synthase [Pseudomonadota bacterium]
MAAQISRPRLLIAPGLQTDAPDAAAIEAAVQVGDVASAILNHQADAGLVGLLQGYGVAVLIADDAATAQTLGADGVHLTTESANVPMFDAAKQMLGGDAIVGAACGADRHRAMLLAEAGADYIAFDITDDVELALWWATVFEVPAVTLGRLDADNATRLAAAGVEFLGVGVDVAHIRAIDAIAAAHPFEEV